MSRERLIAIKPSHVADFRRGFYPSDVLMIGEPIYFDVTVGFDSHGRNHCYVPDEQVITRDIPGVGSTPFIFRVMRQFETPGQCGFTTPVVIPTEFCAGPCMLYRRPVFVAR